MIEQLYYRCDLLFTEPKMGELHIFTWSAQGKKKKIRVIKSTCAKWQKIGDILGCDPHYLKALHQKHQGDPEDTCRDIFCEWLEVGAFQTNYEMSWEGVMELLDDLDYTVLVRDLKEALQKKN